MRMLGLAVAIAFIASPVAAQAQTVPVDPGLIAKGRPIVGTTQNLPSLDSEHPYDVGPGTASQLRRIYQNGTIRALQQEVAQDARKTVTQWIRKPEPEALLNATIFFDFRALYGNETLARNLSAWLLEMTAHAALFLRFMAENALKAPPPLGLIRDFSFDNNADFPHTLDLKAFGARLFVDAARIIALAHGIPHSNTVERLRAAAAKALLGSDDINAMIEGFFFIQQLRLRNQRAGTPPGGENRVDPDKLNELDRQVLKEAFKQAKRLQSRLQLEYRL